MQYEKIKNFLDSLGNPVDKLDAVMDLGRQMEPVPDGAQCSEISGCSSRVEICVCRGKLYGRADSGLVAGIVAILLAMVDGKSFDDIKKMDLLHEFSALGLQLGAARLSGLNSMIRFLQNL